MDITGSDEIVQEAVSIALPELMTVLALMLLVKELYVV